MKGEAQPQIAAPAAARGAMSATIDGAAWHAEGTPPEKNIEDALATVDPKTGYVTIRGTRIVPRELAGPGSGDQTEVIEITLKSTTPGSYTLSPDFDHLQTATFSLGADTTDVYFIHEHQSGEVVVAPSDSNAHLSGSFHFDAKNAQGKEVKISNGAFNVILKR